MGRNSRLKTPARESTATGASPHKQNGPLLYCFDKRPFIATFTDGLSNTILLVEGDERVPWTKPEDLHYAADRPLPKLGGLHRHGFVVAMADGSVRMVSKKTSEKTIRAAITPNGGEILGPDWDQP
jgi:hypothetical protein